MTGVTLEGARRMTPTMLTRRLDVELRKRVRDWRSIENMAAALREYAEGRRLLEEVRHAPRRWRPWGARS